MTTATAPVHRSLLASVEERFLVPAYASPRPEAWIATHDVLALPFQLRGAARRAVVQTTEGVVRVLEIGRGKQSGAFCSQLLGTCADGAGEGMLTLCNPTELERLESDLVLAEIHRWMAPRFRRAGWIIIPTDVRWRGTLSHLPPPHATTSLKSDLAKVRKFGYTIEHASTPEDWDRFYETMVLPQARARFGEDAWIPSERLRRELSRRGELHFIRRDGVRVAGICTICTGHALWLPVMGLCQGDPGLLREGVYSAVFSLVFEWARGQGYTHVDAGRTSSFTSDGVQHFKRKWGLEPVADPLTHLIAARVGPGARAAFVREPVLIETERGIETYPEAT
jgi:GNAT acetyltransferase-like protein